MEDNFTNYGASSGYPHSSQGQPQPSQQSASSTSGRPGGSIPAQSRQPTWHISIAHAMGYPSPNPMPSEPSLYGAIPSMPVLDNRGPVQTPNPFASFPPASSPRHHGHTTTSTSRTSTVPRRQVVSMYLRPNLSPTGQAAASSSSSSGATVSGSPILNSTVYSSLNDAPLIRIITDDSYLSGYTVFEYLVPTSSPPPSVGPSTSNAGVATAHSSSQPGAPRGTNPTPPERFALVEWPTNVRKLNTVVRQPGTRQRKVETFASVEIKGILTKVPTGRWLERKPTSDGGAALQLGVQWQRRMMLGGMKYVWICQGGNIYAYFYDEGTPTAGRHRSNDQPLATISHNELAGTTFLEIATDAGGQPIMSLESCVVAMTLFFSKRDID